MYYIVETESQLSAFSKYDFSKVFVDVIYQNEVYHHSIAKPSLLYIKPFKSRMGFMLPIDHTESVCLSKEAVLSFLEKFVGEIYAIDAKRFLYFFDKKGPVHCMKTAFYLKTGEVFQETQQDTQAHKHFYFRYSQVVIINKLIPISKHFEKLEAIVKKLSPYVAVTQKKYYPLYGQDAPFLFKKIESEGIGVDPEIVQSEYSLKDPKASLRKDKVYCNYNNFTATGRPSNSFNGINFGALNKKDNSRTAIVPKKDLLVEFDYSSYHLEILSRLIGYKFEEDSIHLHLSKYYFKKEDISKEEYEKSKGMTFEILFNRTSYTEDIPFFLAVFEFKEVVWKMFKEKGKILSPLTKRPIFHIENKTQLLPYILQTYETERNLGILNNLVKFLEDKESSLVLYCYDSFLFDVSKKDGSSLLQQIEDILTQDNFKVSIKYGKDYKNMKSI